MTSPKFPQLDLESMRGTRDALHAYARVLGDYLKAIRDKRKHWWHASLRPSLLGVTTGVISAEPNIEMELDFRGSCLCLRTATGEVHREALKGQSARQLADVIDGFLCTAGIDKNPGERIDIDAVDRQTFAGYSGEQANTIGRAFSDVAATMSSFRAGIREESSPIQIWPHHFDLSMLWLPGELIAAQDPDNEEYADKQMNFGFVLGDDSISQPYFYITAYPLPDALAGTSLPPGATWQTKPFPAAVLLYETLAAENDPSAFLLTLWRNLLDAGRTHMLDEHS